MNTLKPVISVLMTTYNEPVEWLKKSIESILAQSFGDFEFIIINDNPSNIEAEELIKEYFSKDSRILYLKNESNIGLTKSLNIGLRIAKGKYIARMDADDISVLDRLEMQFEFMENNPEYVLCGSWISLFNDNGLNKLISDPSKDEEIKSVLLMRNCIAHPSVFIRRQVLSENSIYYNENFKYSQDYDFFCKLSFYGSIKNLPIPLVKYRKSNQQISNKNIKQVLFTYKARHNYFIQTLKHNKISVNDKHVLSKIKSLNVSSYTKRYLLASFYSSSKLQDSMLLPILNGDILKLKDLYFSCIKRSYYQRVYNYI